MKAAELSDSEVFAAFRGVLIDRDNIAHYRGLLRGELLINQCGACGYWIYPHRPLCPRCLSWDVKPTQVSGAGKVFMFTLIQQERVNIPKAEPQGDVRNLHRHYTRWYPR